MGMILVPMLEIPLLFLFHMGLYRDVSSMSEKGGWRTRENGIGARQSRVWVNACIWFLASIYFVCRVIAMVETLYSLHSSPSSAFVEVRWTGYLPNFS